MIIELDGDDGRLLPLFLLFQIGAVGTETDTLHPEFLPLRLQLNAAHDAVPVALRLVGDAVGVLSHADILDAVIYTDENLVGGTRLDVRRHVVAMGCRERQLVAHGLAVDIDGGLNVGTLQIERDATVLPLSGHVDALVIPRRADIVTLGRQEERKLHLSLHAVLLHVGVEVVAGVVERARPLGVHADGITLAVGQHGTGQHDVVGETRGVADGEVPRTFQRDDLLCPCGTSEK